MTRNLAQRLKQIFGLYVGLAVLASALWVFGIFGSFGAFEAAGQEKTQNKFPQQFLEGLAKEAEREGLASDLWRQTRRLLEREGISLKVLERNRYQPEFLESLHRYTVRRLDARRIQRGQQRLRRHAALLRRLERQYGVPSEILVAIWGLESDYGEITGKFPVLQATATLSLEGRRAEFFRKQFFAGLRIAERELFAPQEMLGSWAGAMGHMQFIPTTYLHYARDGDNDGRIDVWHNIDDALTSAANYLRSSRWGGDNPQNNSKSNAKSNTKSNARSNSWGLEVRLPKNFEIALANDRWRKNAFWRKKGIKSAHRSQQPRLAASGKSKLLLPSGATGPAFLVSENFRALLRWNNSTLYALAVGLLADRLDGASTLWQKPVEQTLRISDIRKLQERLNALGFDVGEADAIFGTRTRQALKRYQRREGLVPDGFPSPDTLQKIGL